MNIQRSIHIDASPDAVWAVTMDVEKWPEWTATTQRIERIDPAPLAIGKKARISLKGLRPGVWTVTELDAPRRFVWETSVLPGARMIATHNIEPDNGASNVTLIIESAGPLAFLLRPFSSMIGRSINTEAEGLKARTEANVASTREPQATDS